jgi:hypothetical protein
VVKFVFSKVFHRSFFASFCSEREKERSKLPPTQHLPPVHKWEKEEIDRLSVQPRLGLGAKKSVNNLGDKRSL